MLYFEGEFGGSTFIEITLAILFYKLIFYFYRLKILFYEVSIYFLLYIYVNFCAAAAPLSRALGS